MRGPGNTVAAGEVDGWVGNAYCHDSDTGHWVELFWRKLPRSVGTRPSGKRLGGSRTSIARGSSKG